MRRRNVSVGDRSFALVMVLASLPLAIHWQTIEAMSRQWSTEAYRHGWIVPIVSIVLLWRKRERYSGVRLTGSWIGAAWLAGLCILWMVADTIAVQSVAQVCVVLMASAFVMMVLGQAAYEQVRFPLAFLIFAVPVGISIVPSLMDSTATIAVTVLQAFGVPALREGMMISLPGGTFEVVEACSGYNYLNAGLALAVLVAHFAFLRLWKQTVYVCAALVVFMLVNGLRAVTIMWVGSASDMRFLVGREHIWFGWALFVLAMWLMFWLAERLSDTGQTGPRSVAE
jgi:exosortase A